MTINDSIRVCEVFNSLQGEFPDVASPYTFIRLLDCNYKCPWCHYEDGVSTYNVNNIDITTIDDVRALEHAFIRTIQPFNLQEVVTRIQAATTYVFDAYVNIDLENGKNIKTSFDHSFLTKHGWAGAIDVLPNKTKIICYNGESSPKVTEVLVTRKQVINEEIRLTSIKTENSTFIYNGIVHHNCDTADKLSKLSLNIKLGEIYEMVKKTRGILITGGEPTIKHNLQITKMILEYIAQSLKSDPQMYISRLAIETNGTNILSAIRLLGEYRLKLRQNGYMPRVFISWSPKFYSEQVTAESLNYIKQISKNNKDVFVKIVYKEENEEIISKFLEKIITTCGKDMLSKISFMPEATDKQQLLSKIPTVLKKCGEYGINFSPRLHILLDLP